MAQRGWRIAQTLSAVLYYSGALWVFDRLDRLRAPGPRCTVLGYHRVASERVGYREICVAPETLRAHVRHLTTHGYDVLTLAEYTDYLAGRRRLTRDSVLLTFDDGYRDNFTEALPILRAAGVPATVFVVTGAIEGPPLWWDRVAGAVRALRDAGATSLPGDVALIEPVAAMLADGLTGSDDAACTAIGAMIDHLKDLPAEERAGVLAALEGLAPAHEVDLMMTWAMLEQLRADGIDIGAHTVTHPMLSRLSADDARAEIEGSRHAVHQRLGIEATAFAYPYGKSEMFTDETVTLVGAAGFSLAFTTENGRDEPGTATYRLRRDGMRDVPAYVLAARLAGVFEHPALQWIRALIEHRRPEGGAAR